MPTVQQLPPAATVNPTDELMLDQSGTSVSATVQQLIAASAPALTLTGDVTGAGTGTVVTTIAPVTTPGTFSKVTVNAKGQVTGGGAVAGADVVAALGYTPYNSANPAGYVGTASLATVATTGSFADLSSKPTIGTLGSQNANAVAITGGAVSGVDLSASPITAAGSTIARSLAARASDLVNVLDYGADPTGVADSAPAFLAAMNAVPIGNWGNVRVPRGNYRLGSFVNEPSGRLIALVFEDGANITGNGVGVERVESTQGAYSMRQGGGGWFGFSPSIGAPTNLAFQTDVIQNTPQNSSSMRVAWNRVYENFNYYGKYVNGIDIAEQNIYSWPHIYDNSSGWGHWEVINGPIWDEDSAARAHVGGSGEHSEFDVVSNGPEAGWTFRSGQGLPVQGMSMDPWGQNGLYGGNILYAYGSVGSFDGQTGGLNNRWTSYPAAFSTGNASPVAQNSTIVVTFDLTAHGTASLSGTGGISGIAISNGGGAYTSAPTVVFSGGGGSGAVGIPVMLGGSVIGVTVTSPGTGYTSPPTVSFTGGGVASPSPVTITLNADGAHGNLASVAAAINAANIPNVRAAVNTWGGVISRLVVFGIASSDLGTLTLGGTALATLGLNAGAYTTLRDTMVVVIGGTGRVAVGDKLTINNTVLTVGGTGALSDVINTINNSGMPGIRADTNGNGQLVLTAWIPQNPGGMLLSQPAGYTTLSKLGLVAGTFWPPTPPKAFATAHGELSTPICRTTDQIAISATDINGNSYGPVTVTLNGGAGTGWPADVANSIQGMLTIAGWANNGSAQMLSTPPAVVVAYTHGAGGNQGVILRNTAGGTLTLANVTGTPLQTLGMTPGTYQPGGFSAASQSVFMAAEDSIAPQGRGVFIGGVSNATDRTVWPNTPMEARGGFLHGFRTDKATFDDGNALVLAGNQAIAFGSGSGSLTLSNVGGSLAVNGTSVASASAVPTQTSQLTNDAGFIAAPAIPAGAGRLLGGTAAAGTATTIALGANLTLAGGTLSAAGVNSFNGRGGVVSLSSADVTGALGYAPGSGGGTVSSVVAGAGLAGGTISTTGTVSLGPVGARSLMGNASTLSAVPSAIAVGAGMTLTPTGTLSNSGVVSFNSRVGAVSLGSADVTGALSFTPANAAGDTFSGKVTLNAGGVIASGSTLTATGATFSGGTLVPSVATLGGNATAVTQAAGDNSTKLATTAYVYQATTQVASVAVSSGTITLTPAQYMCPVISLSGTLAGNVTLVFPNSGYWFIDGTGVPPAGASISAQTAGGTPISLGKGYTSAIFANGTNCEYATQYLSSADLLGVNINWGTLTNNGTISGGTLAGTMTNAGTITGGTLSPSVLVAGSAGSTMTVSQGLDAGGYHPVMIKTGGTNTNVPLVFAPGGTGYIAAALADGTTANGNQRGQYALDLQQSRAANTQVASGAYAVVPGGASNTAGGSYSFAAGQGSIAAGQGSVALGQYANDGGAYGKLVFSSNASSIGNQWGVTTLFVSSVSAATRMTSDGAAVGAQNSIPIRSNHVIAGTLTVTARNVSTGDGAIWNIPVLFKNSAGTVGVTNPGTSAIAPTAADSSLSTASVTITADNTNKSLSVIITPPASTTISASAVFLATEM